MLLLEIQKTGFCRISKLFGAKCTVFATFLTNTICSFFYFAFSLPLLSRMQQKIYFAAFCAYMQRRQQNTGLMSPLNINLSLFVCLLPFALLVFALLLLPRGSYQPFRSESLQKEASGRRQLIKKLSARQDTLTASYKPLFPPQLLQGTLSNVPKASTEATGHIILVDSDQQSLPLHEWEPDVPFEHP